MLGHHVRPFHPVEPPRTRVLVADQSFLVVQGIVRILERAGMSVPATASHGDDLGRLTRRYQPDVVMADLRLSGHEESSGLEAVLWLRRTQPRAGVVALADRPEPQLHADLGYCRLPRVALLAKDRIAEPRTVVDTVRWVNADYPATDDPGLAPGLAALSPPERTVLALMAKGRSDVGIAYLLSATLPAVERQVASILHKLDLPPSAGHHRRVQAVRLYLSRADLRR